MPAAALARGGSGRAAAGGCRGMWRLLVLAACVCAGARAAAAGDWRYGGGSASTALPVAPEGAGPFETQALLNVSFMDRRGAWRWEPAGEPGLFARGRVGGTAGLLVPLLASAGAGPGCSPNVTAARGVPPGEPWIALVQRGGCNYDLKVENAWQLNAVAVVIYNNDDSPALQKMPLNEKRNISGVFITKKRGEELVKLVANSPYVFLNISVGPTQARSYNINRTSVLFVSISFIVLMMISLAWLVFYYVQRFRYIHAKDRLSRRLCSAARKALSKIPTKTIKTEDKEMQGEYECCAVCIEPYKVSDVLRILPCRHEFHKSCIDPWLLEHRTCPMCKMDILKHYGFVFTGSQESILHVEIEEVVGLSPTASPEPDSSRQNMSPRARTQNPDQQLYYFVIFHRALQPPMDSADDGRDQLSRSSTPEDMRPTTSSNLYAIQNVQPPLQDHFASSETADLSPQPMVCSSCGSDLVTKCDAVCNTSPLPKEEFSCDIEEEISDKYSIDNKEESDNVNDSDINDNSACQNASPVKQTKSENTINS